MKKRVFMVKICNSVVTNIFQGKHMPKACDRYNTALVQLPKLTSNLDASNRVGCNSVVDLDKYRLTAKRQLKAQFDCYFSVNHINFFTFKRKLYLISFFRSGIVE